MRYRNNSDDSVILSFQFGVFSYFDPIDLNQIDLNDKILMKKKNDKKN